MKKNSYNQRRENKRTLRRRYLVVCEGEIECIYFRAINLQNPNITSRIFPKPKDPEKIIKDTISRIKYAKSNGVEFDEVWCVFDRDSNTVKNLKSAFQLANQHEINIAFSSPCLELWFLLHFKEITSEISTKEAIKRLSDELDHDYDKGNLRDIENKTIPLLLKNEEMAMANAKKIEENTDDISKNPSTSIFKLVISLRK